MTTPEYDEWRNTRINDNIPMPSQRDALPIEEHLRVVPSELEIIRGDFENKSRELGKKIEQLEEEKMQIAGLGKTSEQWRQEIREEKTKADQWEKKCQNARVREDILKKSLLESQSEKEQLRVRTVELERSLHLYRTCNLVSELRASQSKVEELKRKIEELKTALQNGELQVELLNEHWREQSIILKSRTGIEIIERERKKKGNLEAEHSYGTRAKLKKMDQRLEQFQKEVQAQVQEQLAKIQQDMMESQRNMMSQIAQMTQLLNGLIEKGKCPTASTEEESEGHPPGFTPPPIHAMQRGYSQGEPVGLGQRPTPPAHLGQGIFTSNPGANPAYPIVPDLDDPAEIARLKMNDQSAQDKYRSLEERLNAIEGTGVFSALGAKELSLMPDLVLPPKFKAPDFEKYDGTRCPKAHLIMFCRKMAGYVNEDKLLIHCFQDSLVESAFRWYNQLSRERIRSWMDLASAFCEQYKHVSDMVLDRLTLQMMEKKPTETFRQYAQRWRDISIQVDPRLTKTEITVLFINTLKVPFYDRLGHSTENCIAFKRRVQGLIDARILRFDGTGNVAGNPLPNHAEGNVSAVMKEDVRQAKSSVSEIKTPLRKVWKVMIENGSFCHPNKTFKGGNTKSRCFCDFHGVEGHDIQSCEEFRKLLQGMMNNKEIKIFDKTDETEEKEICASDNQPPAIPYSADRPLVIYYEAKKKEVKPTVVIKVPSPFPYKDDKAVPWKYDANIVVPESEKPKAVIGDISKVGHFTRSGRCYSPEMSEQEIKRLVNEDEAHKFLKFIKHSEYNIVEQLNKQPARISMLSLLLNSEPHRNALLKVLNQAYVESNVSIEKLDRWVNNLNADNFISFSDDEIPPNGRGSVKALHITTNCKGYIVPNVLIDNGSALNVMPLATLSRMPVDMSYLRPCHSTVRAFDGTRREVMGKIEIPLDVGPCTYDIEFQVMDISPSYNCLLGRPWIHFAGAVPSSLHQKVKFVMDNRLITVAGEEDIVASISTDAPYIDVNKDAVECSFHSFEFINATFVVEGNKIPTPKLSRNTKMGIKLTVGKGARAEKGLGKYQQGIVRALKPVHHRARYGLGFKPDGRQRRKQWQKDQERRIARVSGRELEWEPLVYLQLSKTFTSAGMMYPGRDSLPNMLLSIERGLQNVSINVMDKGDDAIEDVSMIRPCPPGFTLNNWTAVDLLVVSKSSPECSHVNDMNNPVTSPKIDFEKAVCLGECEAEEDAKDYVSSPDLLRMMEREDKQILPYQESVEIVNLGNEEKRQEVKIGTSISENTKHDLIALLQEYKDVFAWSYQDMPGLNEDVVVHRLLLKPECKPIQQKLRRMRPGMLLKIKEEVKKQFDAGFLHVSKYPEWVANIVSVPKKDDKVRMCVDYRDLNRASPKDNFPLPHIDTLVDNTAKHSLFSFMDGFSGYNQIKMAPEDMEKTTFVTMWGTFYYKVVPFGLKNVGATYQRAMVMLFHGMMHKEIEVYVDDMIAKSRGEREHVGNLRKLFERLRKFQLKLNPAKCTFEVTSGKLLGFIVSEKCIEVDPDKIKAIQELPPPRTQKEVRGFLGRLNYIARFIAQLTNQCDPIFRLLQKRNPGEWNEECQVAFDKIKQYLSNPPVLVPPTPGRPLILYLTVFKSSMGCVLGQHDESGKRERAIYYLSKKFTEYEAKYPSIEKFGCALVWVTRRLRQYMLYHTTWLISKLDPIKYMMESPALSGRMARWQILLSEYDIIYVNQKSIKGSAIADFLATRTTEEYEPLRFDFPDEGLMCITEKECESSKEKSWKMSFDGASNALGHEIGAVLVSPEGNHYPFTARLNFFCTNNVAEYEACVMGLRAAIERDIEILEVYRDSALVIYQIRGDWEVRDSKLVKYRDLVAELIKEFKEVTFNYFPREENQLADALATLASMFKANRETEIMPLQMSIYEVPAHCFSIEKEAEGQPWFQDILEYVKNQRYPEQANENDKKTIRRMAVGFVLDGGILYKRGKDQVLLRCVDAVEARQILEEVHEGVCGTHANGFTMARQIMRLGYY
ncbi:gag/pol polyprotein [Gossypium australe]|uniref:RNA-directed DNA polymerase n=1 Tax=Gossypium australe TaxID=47621 RepID=A0A5B6VUR9_9ROSI|nr:gag/pol polyprotein [Gossypium australe]